MPDILRTSTSALVAFQRALAVTGNNISNANTDGYSRQRVELASRPAEQLGSGFIGNGVDVTTVRRYYDQFATTTLRDATTLLGQQSIYADFAGRIDNITGDTNAGLSASLQAFFNSWQTVANDPASITNRQLLLGQAQALGDRFQQLSSRLASVGDDVAVQMRAQIHDVNSLATSIATLNDQITTSQAAVGGQPANDLLDKRDQLLLQLASLVDVKTTTDKDGAVNVFIGSGQPIVMRGKAFLLDTVVNQYDTSRLDVTYTANGTTQTITSQLTGGKIGGLLTVQSDLIDQTRNSLGRLATGLADLVNDQQALGVDLRGQFGQPLFDVGAPLALRSSANTGNATLTASIPDPSALGTRDFQLRFDGTNWLAFDAVTSQSVPVTTAAGVPSGTVVSFGGVSISVNVPPNAGTAPAAGDSWLVRPTQAAAGGFHTLLSDPRSVAAASPIRTIASAANIGNGAVSAGQVVPGVPPAAVVNPALQTPVTIRFTSATTYDIVNASNTVLTSGTYTAGGNIDFNGWRVQVTGAPAVGDSFQVLPNTGGVGDNRNALAMAALANRGYFDGGGVSVGQAYSSLVATVGNDTRQSQIARDAQTSIVNDATSKVEEISGVNLDEEAADLLRWQQAYGAAAKCVSVADEAFRTLLNAVGN
jgi:flagellar hook-associated protein 1 FlgK